KTSGSSFLPSEGLTGNNPKLRVADKPGVVSPPSGYPFIKQVFWARHARARASFVDERMPRP
ncbi:MAG: hypothetical protein WB368_17995, partial [Candidatus Sulfotelmatobacter sp.]